MKISILLLLLLCGLVSSVQAQDKPAAPDMTFAYINDLGLLKSLEPLKLSQEQLNAIVAEMKAIYKDGEAGRKADADALKALSADVTKARTSALAGEPVPAELETRVKKAFQESDARIADARKKAVSRLLVVFKKNLTSTQMDTIEAQAKKVLGGTLIPNEFKKDPSKAPKEVVQDLMVSNFIDTVLLNERAIEVFSALKIAPAKP